MGVGTIPSVPLTGVRLKFPPLQIVADIGVTDGVGLTETFTVKDAPVHGPSGDVGVTVYTATCGAFVGLTSVPEMASWPVPPAPPVIPPVTEGAAHVYVVFAGTRPLVTSAGVSVKVPPLQIVVLMLVTAGIGLTVTITVNVEPVQLPDFGVTVYVAVCTELVVLVSVPLILAAFVAAVPPVIPPDVRGAAQL